MSHTNTYESPSSVIPPDVHALTTEDEYDHYFMFPVKTLESDRMELRPFIPSLHAQPLFDRMRASPELQEFLFSDFLTVNDVLIQFEMARRDPAFLHHAIFTAPPGPHAKDVPVDKYVFAGVIGMINCSDTMMSAEIGGITLFPEFQRTHVLTHAAGLCMQRILDPPSQGGLGLRRCVWFTNSLHVKSQASAKRLGFTFEGSMRAQRILPLGKKGARKGRPGEKQELMSRDTWVASVIWEEWEGGTRDHVDALMVR